MFNSFVLALAVAGADTSQFADLELQLASSPTIKKMQAEIDDLKSMVAKCPCINSQLSGAAPATSLPATAAPSGTQPQFVQICENGVCRLVPVAGSNTYAAPVRYAAPTVVYYGNGGNYTVDPATGQMDCSGGTSSGGFFKSAGRGLFGRRR